MSRSEVARHPWPAAPSVGGMPESPRVAIVTGSESGIGRATDVAVAEHGITVNAVAPGRSPRP